MFRKLLIANRGEIAVRIMRTARRLGIATVAVYSDADRDAYHVAIADEAFHIGPSPASRSYLDQHAIISAALISGAEAIHPGYGFLSENPEFAEAVAHAGLVFVGPPPAAIRAMGLKDRAKQLMQEAGVPLVPGYHDEEQGLSLLQFEARRIGYPVLIKPVAGGGGKGMRIVKNEVEFQDHLDAARREAISAFGDGRVLIEKFLTVAWHIEVQIMADAQGNIIHLFERDCSLQRRNQKVIEEAPAPGMTPEIRAALCDAAIAAARQVGYAGAGTVEFIADVSDGLQPDRIYFIEMNTRLQVEHPVTEMITGFDLVELQLRVASGEALPLRQQDVVCSGHAIEARIYAEDPSREFQPQTGRINYLSYPEGEGLRADLGIRAGDLVQPFYDPMIGKLIAHGGTRAEALEKLARALVQTEIRGCRTNIAFLSRLVRQKDVAAGHPNVGLIDRHLAELAASAVPPIVVIAVALLSASGRLTVPASQSPFDTLSGFRLWGGDERSFALSIGGETQSFSLTENGREFIVSSGTETLAFALVEFTQNRIRIDMGGRIVGMAFSRDAEAMTIIHDGLLYEIEFEAGGGTQHAEIGNGTIMSPVPGLVSKVGVKVGDPVRRGDLIAVIEAMKMEFQLKADCDGVIRSLFVSEGGQIAEGTIVVEIGDDKTPLQPS